MPIGQGGMGRVWAARETESGPFPRWVAIKTALAEDSSSRQFWTVLLDEAHIASRLRHPNVCAIHAVETERSVVYLVMDWSDAGSLREVLDAAPGERISCQLAARIIASVCAGLHAAHELTDEDGSPLGVVHRDVSPQNILFSTSGQVKVSDFGVAKARGQLQEATRTGEIKGKLSYMAPEQVTLKDFDRRADVFALGCVLYEATLGRRPFHGNDALATLYSLLEQPLTRPSEVDPDYPPGLEAILLKALERNPDARYSTAEELGYALEAWMTATRAIVMESHIATLLRDTLGDRIKERAKALQEVVRKIDAGELTPPALEDDQRTRTQLEMSSEAAVEAAPKKMSWAVPAVAALCVVAIGGALLLRKPAPITVSAAASLPVAPVVSLPVAPASSAIPTVKDVTVSIRTEPASAKIFVDDGSAHKSPYSLTLPSDSATHRIRVTASGYRDKVVEVKLDRDHALDLELEPLTRAAGASRRGPGPVGGSPVESPAAPVVKPRGPADLPPPVEKAPRNLDADNPFAKTR